MAAQVSEIIEMALVCKTILCPKNEAADSDPENHYAQI